MKIVILLLAFTMGMGATIKKTSKDIQEAAARAQETYELREYPNVLPVVEVVAPQI
ncbi:hypothetical protein [Pontibacter ruber]|uniref:Uncharacterized protein n=1 Tax=Pontibacter ruber TaxID=1343895 RepID=A0ABW5CZY1_9BACT|nr:hypothetical protein [Pontibacter ruber]